MPSPTGPGFGEPGERSKRIQALEDEISDLREELNQKNVVINKLQSDLREYRLQPFTDDDFEGGRKYEEQLITILNEGPVTIVDKPR